MEQLAYMAKKIIMYLLVIGIIVYYFTNMTHANHIIGMIFGGLGTLYTNIIKNPLNSIGG